MILGSDPYKATHARAFQSRDGSSWKGSGLPGGVRLYGGVRWPNGYTNVDPVAIVPTSEGFAALGLDKIPRTGQRPRTNGVLWRSAKGVRWSVVATIKNALVADLADGPDGLLIVGVHVAKDGRRTPAQWISRDGKVWKRQRLNRDGPPPTAIAVSSAGVRLVLGARIRSDLSSKTRLWRSDDGQDWEQAPLPGGLSETDRIAVRGPVATPSGFLLFVREKDRRVETLWRSDDGLDWEQVPLSEGWSLRRSWIVAQPWPWRSLVIDARTFPGYMVQPSLLLTSDGGLTWCRADSPGADFKATDAAAGPDGSLLMVGGGGALEWNAWLIHSTHEPIGAGDGEAFPCEPLPAEVITDT